MSAAEVVVVAAMVALLALFVLMALPRGREGARMASCQRNLMQIGQALALYDQSAGHLPTIPERTDRPGDGPLKALLDTLTPVSFTCPSDVVASRAGPAPVSYRATAGDAPDGRDGAFAPGRVVKLADVEAADGLAYTAAFAERLLGDGRDAPGPGNYALADGPIPAGGCPSLDPADWRGDAGSSWRASDWKSTLYNHVLPPGASPSCLARDGRTAAMAASSGHVRGVNVLIFDGSVRPMTRRIDPRIWRAWAAFPEITPTSSNHRREE